MINKLEIKVDKTENSVKSSAVFTKFQEKVKKNREKFNKKLNAIKPEPNNKYGLNKSISKSKTLVIIKAFSNEDNKKVSYTFSKREFVSANGFKMAFKQKEIESTILTKAKAKVKKHYERRGHIYKVLFLWFNIILFLGILFQQKNSIGGVATLTDLLSGSNNFNYLWLTALAVVFIMLLDTLRTNTLIFRTTKNHRPLLSYKSSAINIYYDMVMPIPALTGGKAFEVFYLSNRGVKPSIATSVPLAKYIFGLIASVITSTVVLLFKWSFLKETSLIILVIGLVMLVANFIIIALMLLFATNNKIAPKLVYNVLKVAQKLKLIKNHKEHFVKFMKFILEYQKSIQYYIKTKYVAILSTICSLLITLTKALIPFLIYSIFATPSLDLMLDMMSKYYIIQITVSLIPLPGGMGVSEISFATIFATYFTDGTLFWAVILWRFFSYFIFLLQGVLIAGFGMFSKNSKKALNSITT